jgi:predicted Zn-dependent peptidase
MIQFNKFTLDNGLRVIVHPDSSTPIVTINVLYNVGARDEDPEKTGFAHLFEHLMFGGSANIPSYDTPLQQVGGENNAFTNNDITNYYLSLPKENIETGFWLESDRMKALDFSQKSLDIQKNVVIEEFNQRYLNQPYGDVWLLLRPLAYKKHPYQWATIGKDIDHIRNATLEDVKSFFYSHYAPNNAILSVAGDINPDQIRKFTKKWFGDIEKRDVKRRVIPEEPPQESSQSKTVYRNVPSNAIYKVFHMCERLNKDYYATDLISDILSNGLSSRLYQNLVKENPLFSEINAYISGSIDPGLFIVTGKISEGVHPERADEAIMEELRKMKEALPGKKELEKVKNKVESSLIFSDISGLNKAMNLAYYELLGDADMLNTAIEQYRKVTPEDIQNVSSVVFMEKNMSTLYYLAQ